ncbi:MAG: TRAP transporter small permease subunit [Hyphomicrobiales bacterium]|nr:TRAP transporter small permease subunit [Hyphomicrobiales bacterium]
MGAPSCQKRSRFSIFQKELGMLVRVFDRFVDMLAIAAGILMVFLTALICLDVVARYFRLFAMPWSLEVAKYCLYGITFCGAPWVLRDGGHITIDLFVAGLGARARKTAQKASYILGSIICLTLTFYACRIVYVSWSQKIMINETFVFPEWYLLALAPLTFLVLFMTFLRLLFSGEVRRSIHDDTSGGF